MKNYRCLHAWTHASGADYLISCLKDWNPQFWSKGLIYLKGEFWELGIAVVWQPIQDLFLLLSSWANGCSLRVNDQQFWKPRVITYAMIPKCRFNSTVFYIVASVVYAVACWLFLVGITETSIYRLQLLYGSWTALTNTSRTALWLEICFEVLLVAPDLWCRLFITVHNMQGNFFTGIYCRDLHRGSLSWRSLCAKIFSLNCLRVSYVYLVRM
jgi:hypothetical protein